MVVIQTRILNNIGIIKENTKGEIWERLSTSSVVTGQNKNENKRLILNKQKTEKEQICERLLTGSVVSQTRVLNIIGSLTVGSSGCLHLSTSV